MESADELDFHAAKALLEWQCELGVSDAIGESPINRYEAPVAAPKPAQSDEPVGDRLAPVDVVARAKEAAQAAQTLDQLQASLAAFEHCDLKRGARSLVFSDGQAGAKVMVIGEAPGRDEDKQGKPFVGRAGQLLDAMFNAIDHGRAEATNPIYITNILPWRPPQNRDPSPDEIAMMLPFVERHISLAQPEIIVLMGNISCGALLGQRGITKLRGQWRSVLDRPALPMFHPAYLLRKPEAKREAWSDLLSLKAKLREIGHVQD
ncbi:MAG: uracil-DNA glycosylase [Pseudomonadota bacterium]